MAPTGNVAGRVEGGSVGSNGTCDGGGFEFGFGFGFEHTSDCDNSPGW